MDDTGIVIARIRTEINAGNTCSYCNGKSSKYKSTISFDFDCWSIGFNT